MPCKRCGNPDVASFQRVGSFDRISLADDPADPNCGHYYLDAVHVMRCPSCGHHQERVQSRWPFPSLNEAQKELDSHLVGKG